MDKLSHLILHAVNRGEWKGIKAGRHGPTVSHLMFADDLLLFGEAQEGQMQCVIDVLNTFCGLSGQEVSQEKTSIFFSKNVSRGVKDKLLRISGFRETDELGRYLGVPLIGQAPRKRDFQYLVDQVAAKLTNWKAKQLSFAGRVTLAKSVIEAVPVYPMMSTKIPKSCLNDIQKLQRDFIWGDTTNGRRFHAVSWEKITTPKWMGGLGLRKLDIMNQACLIKLGCKVFSGADEYWCEVLRGKYVQNAAKTTDSSLWKVLVSLKNHVDRCSYWVVGDGRDIEAWEDVWIEEGLCIAQHINIPQEIQSAHVCDLVDAAGNWNWTLFQPWMPRDMPNKIAALLPPSCDYGKDEKVVPGGPHLDFSVSNMYDQLSGFNINVADPVWCKIWRLKTHERVRSFIWLVMWNRVLTNSLKHQMGLSNPMCVYCGTVEETCVHVLRDCPLVMGFWLQVVPVDKRGEFFMSNLKRWVSDNINNISLINNGSRWCDVWAFACYYFWTWRNKEAHENNFIHPANILQHVFKMEAEFRSAMRANRRVFHHDRILLSIGWQPPSRYFVKLNTDGACKEGLKAGCGGVIRGDQGEWLGGFARNVGMCNAFTAELWGVVEGLCLAQRLALTKIELCIDSQAVIQVISTGKIKGTVGNALIKRIKGLLALNNWEVQISHVYREANRCADALANIGCSLDHNVIFYDSCPDLISDIMLADFMGITTPRMIAV